MTERLAVEANGSRLDEQRFPGRQGRILFAYLVAQKERPVPRDELAQLLWGDELPATWEKALRVLMTKLRALLDESGIDGSTALTSAYGCYQLTLPEGAWIDVDAAAAALEQAEAALAAGVFDEACAQAATAAELARRSFLPGEDGPWVEEQRRDLRELLVRALECLRDASLAAGTDKSADAVRYAAEITELEPFRESSYRRLMEAHAAAGNPAEALRVYERCRHFLAEELGAYPSAETEAVYLELLRSSPKSTLADAAHPESHDASETAAPPAEPPPRSRRRRRLVAAGAAVLLVVVAAATAIATTRRGDPPAPPKILPRSLVRLSPRPPYTQTKVIPIQSRADEVFAAGGYIWFSRGILRYANGVGVRNPGERGLWRVDPATGDKEQVPGVAPCGMAPDPSGDMWVYNCYGREGRKSAQVPTVVRINHRTLHSTLLRFPKGGAIRPRGVGYGGSYLWVRGKGRRVIGLDPASGKRLRTIELPLRAGGGAWSHHALWVPAWGDKHHGASFYRVPVEPKGAPPDYEYSSFPNNYSPIGPLVQGDWLWVGDWDYEGGGAGGLYVIRFPAIGWVDGSIAPRYTKLPVKTPPPVGVTWFAARDGAVWATVPDDKAVFRIDEATGKAIRIPLPYYPWGVTVADDGGIWVTLRKYDGPSYG